MTADRLRTWRFRHREMPRLYAKALVDLALARQALLAHHDPDVDPSAWDAESCPLCLHSRAGGQA